MPILRTNARLSVVGDPKPAAYAIVLIEDELSSKRRRAMSMRADST